MYFSFLVENLHRNLGENEIHFVIEDEGIDRNEDRKYKTDVSGHVVVVQTIFVCTSYGIELLKVTNSRIHVCPKYYRTEILLYAISMVCG